ncbi:GGDEF domain-containing protein [Ideonella sp. B7]|uniref:GGDEF domain-containing protein n=1 Tax=Ideonella benzenivorans TaxID=2831643 RepID=UPI001CEC141E|nr:GGDEF domain-containing protein [Ideonella benzenivorans]MCA6215740.1 GGDEF domain-containing protein [Ideonella benzenivorans]
MESRLALTLALVQLGLFGLCWGLIAALMPRERRSALLFLATCACDAATAWLQIMQDGSLRPVAQGLMTLGLGSATLVSAGADAFVHGHVRHRGFWALTLGLGVAATWLPLPAAVADLTSLAVYQTAFLLLLGMPIVWLRQPIHQEFGRYGWLPLLPFGLMGLAVLAFLVHLLLNPAAAAHSYAARNDHGASSLIPFAITSGLFHISWLGMMLGRQVVRANRLARVDNLTGVLRRGPFEAELDAALTLARRLQLPVTLAFLDVDHFKRINDEGGHAAGDRVLQALGQLLRRCLRGSDRCGRWGGEEFVLLLPGMSAPQAPALMRRLMREIAQARIPVPPGCPPLSVSLGYAVWAGDGTGAALVDQADAAMYEAKRRGRNTIVNHAELGPPQAAPALSSPR